jgi:integrase
LKRKFFPLFDLLAAKQREERKQHPEAPERFNWHALRHFAVSPQIEVGLSPKTFAGHSSQQVPRQKLIVLQAPMTNAFGSL